MADAENSIEGLKDGASVPKSDNIEITEIHCHECNGYIKFALDKGKDGEHVLICPKCGHEHCRIIKNGIVTGDRWESRNKPAPELPQQIQSTPPPVWIINVSQANWSPHGTQVADASGNDGFLKDAWLGGTSTGAGIAEGTWYTYSCGSTATATTSILA